MLSLMLIISVLLMLMLYLWSSCYQCCHWCWSSRCYWCWCSTCDLAATNVVIDVDALAITNVVIDVDALAITNVVTNVVHFISWFYLPTGKVEGANFENKKRMKRRLVPKWSRWEGINLSRMSRWVKHNGHRDAHDNLIRKQICLENISLLGPNGMLQKYA